MIKYKVFKDFHMPDGRIYEKGEIVTINNDSLSLYLNFAEYIGEIKTAKPKYKVGDYVVYEGKDFERYVKIIDIEIRDDYIVYNFNYEEDGLRYPTQEELSNFYR